MVGDNLAPESGGFLGSSIIRSSLATRDLEVLQVLEVTVSTVVQLTYEAF